MDNKEIFALNLQKYMEQNDKSRTDIAEALGISYYTVTDWVKGKKYPRMDKVERLAKYFGVKKSDLIENNAEQEKPADDGGLSENKRKLMEFVQTVPEEKAAMILSVIRTIVEAEK